MLDVPGRAIAAGNVTVVRCRELSRECRIAPQRFAGDREDERPRLRRGSDIAVVETTDEGQGDDAAVRRWLDGAWLGRILLEGEVSARPVVVPVVASQTTSKVCLVQDDDVVEKLAAEGANDAFSEGVLPGRARRSENLGQALGGDLWSTDPPTA